jgi:hypothetical protein
MLIPPQRVVGLGPRPTAGHNGEPKIENRFLTRQDRNV